MTAAVHFSSAKEDWETPQDFFDTLDEEFHFNLDPCASADNHKCDRYFTKEENGLCQSWGGMTVFCNPPYGRETKKWVQKAFEESRTPGTVVVMLLAARTDTAMFHDYILNHAEIRFLRGRLKFGGSKKTAPFPSMLAIYRAREYKRETRNTQVKEKETP